VGGPAQGLGITGSQGGLDFLQALRQIL